MTEFLHSAKRPGPDPCPEWDAAADEWFSLETVAMMVRLRRRDVLKYCRWGTIRPVADVEREGWYFDASAIRLLRRAERLRIQHGLPAATIHRLLQAGQDIHL